jgi:hypothetical protein
MRIARASLHALFAVALTGCAADGGHVTLNIDRAQDVRPPFTGFDAGDGTATHDSRNVVTFTATSERAALTVRIQGPLAPGAEIRLGQADLDELRFAIGDAVWAAGGGLLEVDGVNPYRVRFVGVPMRAVAGLAAGTFVFDGAGTFK